MREVERLKPRNSGGDENQTSRDGQHVLRTDLRKDGFGDSKVSVTNTPQATESNGNGEMVGQAKGGHQDTINYK